MPEPDASLESILELAQAGRWSAIRPLLADRHPADLAHLIVRAPSEAHARLFRLLPDELKPAVLAELEGEAGEDVILALSSSALSEIVEDMAPDDAADVLGELSSERSAEVLELMDEAESGELRQLLTYDEDSAGGIMTTDVLGFREGATVQEAIQAIAYFEGDEPVFYAYVIDAQGRLFGYVHLWELLKQRDKRQTLGTLADRDVVRATVDMDQEEAAKLMARYDLSALPVVDAAGRLVGRVTIDDAIDVIEEEASEDILRLAGSDDEDLTHASVLRSCRIRLPWLLVTLCTGFVTSVILKQFVSHVSEILVLSFFVPIVLAMGGNTGVQSSTLIVRRIALGSMYGKSVLQLLFKEMLVGAVMGLLCGVAIGVWAYYLISVSPGYLPSLSPLELCLIVSLSLLGAMTFAAISGASVPVLLHSLGIDPAVASGPFVTTANDISALLIYFGFTVALVRIFV